MIPFAPKKRSQWMLLITQNSFWSPPRQVRNPCMQYLSHIFCPHILPHRVEQRLRIRFRNSWAAGLYTSLCLHWPDHCSINFYRKSLWILSNLFISAFLLCRRAPGMGWFESRGRGLERQAMDWGRYVWLFTKCDCVRMQFLQVLDRKMLGLENARALMSARRQAGRQAGRQADRQTDGRTDRQTDRLRGRRIFNEKKRKTT